MTAARRWETEGDGEVSLSADVGNETPIRPPAQPIAGENSGETGGEQARKRGQPSRAFECRFDSERAIIELEAARELYELADSLTDRRTREDVMRAAHDRVGLAGRFLAYLLQRPAR